MKYCVTLPTVQYALEALDVRRHFAGSVSQYIGFLVSLLFASAGRLNHVQRAPTHDVMEIDTETSAEQNEQVHYHFLLVTFDRKWA